jgi:MarR-like DNA-binding transcriptional regulator SgrR of sgrS sRNA
MCRRLVSQAMTLFIIIFLQTEARAHMSTVQKSTQIQAYLGPIPKNIDPSSVTSFSEYVVIQQLTRGLIHLDPNGNIAGDLAESWKIEKNSTHFYFKLKEKQLFSNNDPITAQSIIGTISRQLKKGKTIHYDFGNIKNIKELNDREVEIILHQPDSLFISKLTYPEFGVLHISDYSKNLSEQCDWKTTSGHTTLIERNKDKLVLSVVGTPKRKIILTSDRSLSNTKLETELDFFIGIPTLSETQHLATTERYEAYTPRLAFTYFLSFGKNSALLKNKPARIAVLSELYEFRKTIGFSSIFNTTAAQLYLPDGPGRTSAKRIKEIQEEHSNGSLRPIEKYKLKILVQKTFPFGKNIVDFFASKGIESEIISYQNFDEFDRLRQSQNIDIIQANNDFSSNDLTSNLMVTLNSARPLVEHLKEHEITDLIDKLKIEISDEKRISLIQKIEEYLLQEGLIFPLFHSNMYFYVSKKRDSVALSRKFPEVALWKIK